MKRELGSDCSSALEKSSSIFDPVLSNLGLPGVVYRKDAAKFLGVSKKTIDRYVARGVLVPMRNSINGRVYFPTVQLLAVLGSTLEPDREVVAYCRSAVLGSPQEFGSAPARLAKQVERVSTYCEMAGIKLDRVIEDIGPGFGPRPTHRVDELMEQVLRKKISTVVVETEDRLGRWSMGSVLQRFLEWHGVKLVVISPNNLREEYVEELKGDLTEIILDTKKVLGVS